MKSTPSTAPAARRTQVQVGLRASFVAALDAWIGRQPEPRPTRAEALRRFAHTGLAAAGFEIEETSSPRTLEEKIGRLEKRLSEAAPAGPPTPEKGMRALRRGLAENRLRTLKQRRKKTSRSPTRGGA